MAGSSSSGVSRSTRARSSARNPALSDLDRFAALEGRLGVYRERLDDAYDKVIAETVGDDDPEPSPSPAMLEAATRWFCALDLPGEDSDSWAGPSL